MIGHGNLAWKFRLVVALVTALLSHSIFADTVETFDTDPIARGWTGLNYAGLGGKSFGYSPSTSFAGGSPGEIGGKVDRSGVTGYYADLSIGQPVNRGVAFKAVGKLDILNSDHSFNAGVRIGYLNHNATTFEEQYFCGLDIEEWPENTGSADKYRIRALLHLNDGQMYMGNNLIVEGFPNFDRNWQLLWEPASGSHALGRLEVSIDGAGGGVSRIDLTPSYDSLNFIGRAFGMSIRQYLSPPFPPPNAQGFEIFLDDLIYDTFLPGDYNNDGEVDAADYVMWKKGVHLQNQGDDPSQVNFGDYTFWRAHFGDGPLGSGGTVGGGEAPEPSALIHMASLLMLSVIAGLRSVQRF